MKKIVSCLGLLVVLATVQLVAEAATENEGKASGLLDKGLAFIKAKGMDAALAEFNNTKGKFVDGEFYLFVFDYDGNCLAHGANQKMVGKNQIEMMDADGKPLIREFIKIAKTKTKGWYDYKWSNPLTKKIQDKRSILAAIPGKDAVIGCGYYK
jgi:cytochrome c